MTMSTETGRLDGCDYGLARARYLCPALTLTVFLLAKSRTETVPRLTTVSVLEHVSCTSHLVPTTVAALCFPFVRKWPLPSPHRRRVFFFLSATFALPAPQLSFPASVSVVSLDFFDWPTLKTPS